MKMPFSVRRPLNKKRKKPGSLPGGTGKKARAQYKSLKGQMFPGKKPGFLAKKRFLKSVYIFGFGNVLAGIHSTTSLIIKLKKMPGTANRIEQIMNEIEEMLEKINMHYRGLNKLPAQFERDPDFKAIIDFRKKLPQLGTLVKRFRKTQSEKNAERIFEFIKSTSALRQKFREVSEKYGAAQEVVDEGVKGLRKKF